MTTSAPTTPTTGRTYDLVHRTTYAYDHPVTTSYGRTVLTPRDLPDQQCHTSTLDIQPAPADTAAHVDYFGNRSTYFAVTDEHRRLVVTSRSTVTVAREAATVAGLPVVAWEDVAAAVRSGRGLDPAAAPDEAEWDGVVHDDVAELPTEPEGPDDPSAVATDGIGIVALREALLPSRHVALTEDVREWAAPSFTPGRGVAEILADLAHRIRTELTYRSGSTTVGTTQTQLLAQRTGVCQDFAHLMVAALRLHGLPARYASGYLETMPPPGREKLRGADASHAWVSAWVPGAGWVEVDPTNDKFIDDRYVVLGWGRDYADVPPLRGVIFTEGSGSRLTVSVDLVPAGSTPLP
ncbi:transglutaminase family protein [Cellulomonas cellasea]|uniref:Transglutaminase-like putative cysteine protease n=1 Tax=Cellulomonas cellasea TaxID=43670 RepID=A0A7W4YBT3_9CELL|nr:transglutaminase family protein [Cellulomonas cellasea]MBB2923394.1 transglutaminase-like putative cysteine protease [Cellulomonas cellasea]